MSLKEQAVIAMIKECIQPLLELKKGFEKQENRADDIIEGLPAEKYPSVNAVINFVKNKITDFSNNLNTVYVKLSDFDVYKKDVKTSFENFEKGVTDTYATKSGVDDFKNSVADTYATKTIVEDLKNDTEATRTATGSAITIESSQAPLQNLKLFGKTEQNGTPTPDAPVPLVSVGDSGSFEVGLFGGKNFVEITKDTTTSAGVTFTKNTDNSFSLSGTCQNNLVHHIGRVYLVKGTQYKITGCPTGGASNTYLIRVILPSGKSSVEELGGGKTYTATETGFYTVGIRVQAGTNTDGLKFYPMIRYSGETDETYEPCNKQTLTIPYTLPNENEVDFGKGTRKEKTVLLTVNGGENWAWNDTTKGFYFYPKNYGITPTRNLGISTHFEQKKDTDLCFFVSGGQNPITIYDYNGKWADLNAFKSWLSENNVTFLLELETPIETPISESELNAYRHLITNKGNTTILSECEDTEITYYVNKPNAQAIGNIHSQVNNDYFKLQQAIISLGGN